ncbi:hypothetical protein BT67DRAFT_435505 [Trichocladium antarcticum]|uniref:Yeast cell wall synthesis Kre9/Knh1-like N-terminal domain-containing protein n=1 Tax=Trichocladium antarcticum TaxID=1450529 RepID=A0AAN6UGB3_9PEZI|nr:hypothetical protein BT67DRAFT_435505 [Trichocladium antarcticum]
MKFSVAALIAFAAAAIAKPILTNSNYEVYEDEAFTLKWSNAEGPVTITLKAGPSTALKTVAVIASAESGNSFTWVPTGLPSGTYAFEINDSTGKPNYSPQFQYVGTGTISTSSESSASSTVRPTSSAEPTSTTETESSSTTEDSSSATESSESSESSESNESATTSASESTSASSTPTTTFNAQETFAPINSNDARHFSSPLALVLGTVAALVFLN